MNMATDEIIDAKDVYSLPIGSLVFEHRPNMPLGTDGETLVVVEGGLIPASFLSESPQDFVPPGEPAEQWNARFLVAKRGDGSVPRHSAASRYAIQWVDARRAHLSASRAAPVAAQPQLVHAHYEDRNGEAILPGDTVRIKMHPRGTATGTVVISERATVVMPDGKTAPALSVDCDGRLYSLPSPKAVLKVKARRQNPLPDDLEEGGFEAKVGAAAIRLQAGQTEEEVEADLVLNHGVDGPMAMLITRAARVLLSEWEPKSERDTKPDMRAAATPAPVRAGRGPRVLLGPTDDQVLQAIDSHAGAFVDMAPVDFLRLTTLDEDHIRKVQSEAHDLAKYEKHMESGKCEVHPFLRIDVKSGQVVGHDGRHRAAAILSSDPDAAMRVALIPVPLSKTASMADIPETIKGEYDPGFRIKIRSNVTVVDANVQQGCAGCGKPAPAEPKERKVPFQDTVLRRDEKGQLHLMNHPEKGWASYGIPYRSEQAVLDEWDVTIGPWTSDKHSAFAPVKKNRKENPVGTSAGVITEKKPGSIAEIASGAGGGIVATCKSTSNPDVHGILWVRRHRSGREGRRSYSYGFWATGYRGDERVPIALPEHSGDWKKMIAVVEKWVASAASSRLENPIVTARYIGFCPVCARRIKVRDDKLVHHGYQRPGYGYIVGDCFAVGMTPHELSPDTAQKYLDAVVTPSLAGAHKTVEHYGPPNEPEKLSFRVIVDESQPVVYRYGQDAREKTDRLMTRDKLEAYVSRNVPPHIVSLYKDEPQNVARYVVSEAGDLWKRTLDRERDLAKSQLTAWKLEHARVANLISTWTQQPLQTVEEEVAAKRASATERDAKRKASVEAKTKEVVDKARARVDSAVKNRNVSALMDIFRNAPRTIRNTAYSVMQFTRGEALKMIERDNVWAAFGLIDKDGSYVGLDDGDSGSIYDALRPWTDSYDGPPVAPWPAALGGGKTKRPI